jgi:hypothetical protein
MAVIDTFLKLMVEKRAERLVLVSDKVPFLLKAGETIELSMPALRAEMLQRISQELAGPSGAPTGCRGEGVFETADGTGFGYVIQPGDPGFRIEVNVLGAVPRGEDVREDDPLALAVAAFAKPVMVETPAAASAMPEADLRPTLDLALSLNATDIFLSSGKPPRVRRNGAIVPLDANSPTAGQILGLLPDEASKEELARTERDVRAEQSSGASLASTGEWDGIKRAVLKGEGEGALKLQEVRHRSGQVKRLSLDSAAESKHLTEVCEPRFSERSLASLKDRDNL